MSLRQRFLIIIQTKSKSSHRIYNILENVNRVDPDADKPIFDPPIDRVPIILRFEGRAATDSSVWVWASERAADIMSAKMKYSLGCCQLSAVHQAVTYAPATNNAPEENALPVKNVKAVAETP